MMRPRRVLMTADAVGGVWDYALELAKALGREGITVELAVLGEPPCTARRGAVSAIGNLRLHHNPGRLEWMEGCEADLDRHGEWLLDLERAVGADIVHINGYAQAALPFRAPVLAVAHSCVLSWWEAVLGEPAPSAWERYAARVRAGLAAADLVLAPSRAMLDTAERHYGPLPHARVIHNGRSSAGAVRPGRKEPLILTAGRLWDAAKNIAALDAVAADLPWPVLAAGNARHPDGGERNLSRLRPLGQLSSPELAAWMSRATIFALPARYEPFGLSVLEAALSGCALVLGDIPSLRELWDGAAFFVPPDDAEALRTALREMIASPDRRMALADAALRRGHRYTAEAMAEGTLAAYADLLDRRARDMRPPARLPLSSSMSP